MLCLDVIHYQVTVQTGEHILCGLPCVHFTYREFNSLLIPCFDVILYQIATDT